jgi:hypothetical protein
MMKGGGMNVRTTPANTATSPTRLEAENERERHAAEQHKVAVGREVVARNAAALASGSGPPVLGPM